MKQKLVWTFSGLVVMLAAIISLALKEDVGQTETDLQGEPLLNLIPDEVKNFGNIALKYADTNIEEWKMTANRLDSFYNVQSRLGFNGSVLIGYKGQIMYERYLGYANKSLGINLNPNAASQLASTSKPFTAAAVMLLHQNNYLNIDDLVADYIPNFPYKDVTIRMLLCHRSGLPEYLNWVPTYRKSNNPMSNDEVIDLMVKHKPAQIFKTNTRFKYTNTNYVLLASIVEQVSEMRFPEFLKTYILNPLGMTNTFVYNPEYGLPASSSKMYKRGWIEDKDMFADGVYGDKGLYSTVRDLYKWDQSFYKHLLIRDTTLIEMFKPHNKDMGVNKNYGLGWRMLTYPDGFKVVFHNGWWHGANTCFYRFIQDDFTIIVLSTNSNQGVYKHPQALFKIMKSYDTTSTLSNSNIFSDSLEY